MNRVIIFSAGVVVGGFAGYFFCKSKYEKILQDEINSVKAFYKQKDDKKPKSKIRERKEANDKLYSLSYAQKKSSGDKDWEEAEKVNPTEPAMVPYSITPDEFLNGHSDFAKVTLVYYEENEVLVNEEEETVDIDTNIGYDAINHFGEFEKDAVFVRNEALGSDYEVLMEHSSFYGS